MKNFILLLTILSIPAQVSASALVNMDAIKQIESSGNPSAYNRGSQARGLYQITPIVLKEYNQFNHAGYMKEDLFDPEINAIIAEWYIGKRIPAMLKYYKKEVNLTNIIIAYNAGISYVVKNKPLPIETIKYIAKYKKLMEVTK